MVNFRQLTHLLMIILIITPVCFQHASFTLVIIDGFPLGSIFLKLIKNFFRISYSSIWLTNTVSESMFEVSKNGFSYWFDLTLYAPLDHVCNRGFSAVAAIFWFA